MTYILILLIITSGGTVQKDGGQFADLSSCELEARAQTGDQRPEAKGMFVSPNGAAMAYCKLVIS